MERNGKQPGLTLIEMMVVIAIVALLVSISMPALRQLMDSTATEGTVRGMIGAAMASARAIAAREQRYAGIRFQQDLDDRQYMIFIIQDSAQTGLVNGFRAVDKLTPIELPDTIGVMDLRLGSDGDKEISSDADILLEWQVRDTSSFSVVFSPSGKLVIHNVRVRNRDGTLKWPDFLDNSQDDIFNTKTRVESGIGMFVQDDYAALGL
ncbi:MAG: prepilin-type N-terminal cleavage/methylation domain-containing protein, partial [Planctomycetota bacterium]